MGTDRVPQVKHGHIVFVGSKGSGKTSLYQCLKSPNPQVIDGPNCSILVEDWRPFSSESPVSDECREYFNGNLSEKDLDASVTVWDICGHEALWTTQQLCIPETALFVLVFNVRNPRDARLLPQWVQMIQSKSLNAEVIIAASNCEISEDPGQRITDEVQKMENAVLDEINQELTILRELQSNIWVKSRIEKLERLVDNRPNVCSTVFLTSAVTGKGLSELRRTILNHFFINGKSQDVHNLNEQEFNLIKKLRPLHDGKGIVMSGQDYKTMTSELGFQDEEKLESVTQRLVQKGVLARVNIAGTFGEIENKIIITDPCCFANACAMIHRDENPQDFVNKLQKSNLVQRFWPTSTRANDWTLRSAIDDVVSRGMIRESFLPLCWQIWNMNEEDVKQLLPAMLQLGVLVDGAPKAGYEIELALSYFKNLSVTKRYHLPLLLKLPAKPPSEKWPNSAPSSSVEVNWQYQFQHGFCDDMIFCILAAIKNSKLPKTVIAFWQTGLVLRHGEVEIMIASKPRVFHFTARCKITNSNKQALNMTWASLSGFINITECYLSNFPGLYYQFGSSSVVNSSSRSIHHLLSEYCSTEKSSENLWLIPPVDFQKKEESTIPLNLRTWVQRLSDQSSICIIHDESHAEEAEVLRTNLEEAGLNVLLQPCLKLASSDMEHILQRCSVVIVLLTKLYIEDPQFQENIQVIESLNRPVIGAYIEADLNCSLLHTTNLSSGSGIGSAHIFNLRRTSETYT
ncbi:uncharacterized protein LOC114530594 [Dendronephthya gigantea]|uniref:uncharacterized protein LOC114530594 n=1 Tax=Dendronephthya gigantea TaxID=151771 RepID=UPI00106BF14B|nr:uncharacterized protein LOC114530594 [Dendronephthya gigantea]XP_028407978.1 uncharacterized protein LOC114530594 [Dendronephthya gigantea]XP_028407979.1 uncharacterized protein LOC114530594 [Dendronephthya gigantea]